MALLNRGSTSRCLFFAGVSVDRAKQARVGLQSKGAFSADVSDCEKSWPSIRCGYDNGLLRYDDIAGVSNNM